MDGATRTRTPWRWQRSTSSTASSCGKSASAISTSSMASKWRSSCSSERKSSRPLESLARPARDEAVRLDHLAVAQRQRHRGDVRPRPDEHRTAAVAGRAQHHAADALEHPARRGHVDQREEERPVEDVVRVELVALDLGVDQDHQHHLDERGDHLREAGPLRAVAVEARACEQQHHDEAGERRVVLRLVEHLAERVRRLDRRLDRERGPDRQEEATDVERGEDRDPAERADRVEPEHAAEEQRFRRAYVAVGERDRLDLSQLFDQAVRHSWASVGGTCKPRPAPM